MKSVNSTKTTGVFATHVANVNAGHQRSRQLLSELWHEGELAVMFGDNTVGKSLLAVQAAQAISTGKAVKGFSTETPAQKVLYFDFDNGNRKFAGRYRQHKFSNNFSRVTISKEFTDYHKFGKRMFESITGMLEETGARVIIIDSLNTLGYFVSSSFFISQLVGLKNTFNLSILLLAETKRFKRGKPILLGSLAYNKMLAGVADTVFAMGSNVSQPDGRYLIQLKGKDSGIAYHEGRVIVGRNTVTPKLGNLPGFEFTGYGTQRQQLLFPPTGLDAEILALKQQEPGLSLGEIARWLRTNKMKVKRVLERYSIENTAVTAVTPNLKSEILNSKSEKVNAVPQLIETTPATTSFSNTWLQPAGMDGSALNPTDSLHQGNDSPSHDAKTTVAASFNNPRLQAGGKDAKKSSPCPLLSHTDPAQGGMPNAKPGNNNTPAALPPGPFRGDVECFEHGLSGLRDCAEGKLPAKSQKTLDTVITSTVKNDKTTGALSFSNTRLKPGGKDAKKSSPCTLLSPTDLAQGGMSNAEPENINTPAALPPGPFRGDVELSDQPSDPGVNKKLSYSQQLRQRLNKTAKERRNK